MNHVSTDDLPCRNALLSVSLTVLCLQGSLCVQHFITSQMQQCKCWLFTVSKIHQSLSEFTGVVDRLARRPGSLCRSRLTMSSEQFTKSTRYYQGYSYEIAASGGRFLAFCLEAAHINGYGDARFQGVTPDVETRRLCDGQHC